MLTRCGIVMIRLITPAIFLSASILAGGAADEAPAVTGTEELGGEHGQDGEAPKAAAARDNLRLIACSAA